MAANSYVFFDSNILQTLTIAFRGIALLSVLFVGLDGRPTSVVETFTPNGSLLYNSTIDSDEPSPVESETEFQRSIHLSTSLACLVLFIFILFHVRTSGYQLSSRFWDSTDCRIWVTTLVVSVFWTTFVFMTGFIWDDAPCRAHHLWPCLGRAAFAPWILLVSSIWWFFSYLYYRFYEVQRAPIPKKSPGYSEPSRHPWPNRVNPILSAVVVLCVLIAVAIGAWMSRFQTLAMLSIAASVIYLHAIRHDDYHLDRPHRSRLDDVRIPLWSPFNHCLVYILPTEDQGLEARLTQKIESEHECLDARQKYLSPLNSDTGARDWSLKACRFAMRQIVLHRIRNLNLDCQEKQFQTLASWLYRPGETNPSILRMPLHDQARILDPWWAEPWQWIIEICSPIRLLYLAGQTNLDEAPMPLFDHARVAIPWWIKSKHWIHKIYSQAFWFNRLNENGGDTSPKTSESEPKKWIPASEWMLDTSKVGREVVMALLHWETLVFERRWDLPNHLMGDVWKLRSRAYSTALDSGYNNWPSVPPKGAPEDREGRQGLKDAVSYALQVLHQKDDPGQILLDDPLYRLATNPTGSNFGVPKTSVIDKEGADDRTKIIGEIANREAYINDIWNASWAAENSTFGALYLFLEVLYLDLVNIKGLHIAPLQPIDGAHYCTEWRLKWRHVWQSSIVCQLVIMLPTIVNSFFAVGALV